MNREPAVVLLADDDDASVDPIRSALQAEGLRPIVCRRAPSAVEAVGFHRPSAVIVDVSFDGGRGWDVLHAARANGPVPLLVLDRERDGVARRTALAAGADEVVTKPVDAAELAARAVALTRRGRLEGRGGSVYRHADLVMDVAAHEVRVAGRPISLTAQQFAILRALFEARGATLERSQLLARIAPLDSEPPSDRAIDLHVSRLRRRLGEDPQRPRYIRAVYGVGYRLATDSGEEGDELATRSREVLDALPDALLVVDDGLTVRFANTAAERMLASQRTGLVGRHCGEILRCQGCDGTPLDGPKCFGRAVLSGDSELRDVPGIVSVEGVPMDVMFSYGRTDVGAESPLLTINLRRRKAAS